MAQLELRTFDISICVQYDTHNKEACFSHVRFLSEAQQMYDSINVNCQTHWTASNLKVHVLPPPPPPPRGQK